MTTDENSKQEEPADQASRTTEAPSEESRSEPQTAEQQLESLLKEMEEKLLLAQQLADTYKDQLLRKAAEFENYKKRTEAEFATLVRNANEGLIGSLIPVLDDFGRSLKSGREVKEHESFYKGVELIHNKFLRLLESHGLIPFDSAGKPFDVDFHDALMQVSRPDLPAGTVIEEIERGYKLFDRIIRHAKVIVSSEAPPPSSAPPELTEGEEPGNS